MVELSIWLVKLFTYERISSLKLSMFDLFFALISMGLNWSKSLAKVKLLSFLSILITISIILMILLTNSRGALSSVFLSFSLLFPSKIFSQTFLIFFLFAGALISSFFFYFPLTTRETIKFIIPNQLIDKLITIQKRN